MAGLALVLFNVTLAVDARTVVRPGVVRVPALGVDRTFGPWSADPNWDARLRLDRKGLVLVLDVPGGPVLARHGAHLQLRTAAAGLVHRARRAVPEGAACTLWAWTTPAMRGELGTSAALRMVQDAVGLANSVLEAAGLVQLVLLGLRSYPNTPSTNAYAALASFDAHVDPDEACVHALFGLDGYDEGVAGLAHVGYACATAHNTFLVTGDSSSFLGLVLAHEYGHACSAVHPEGTCAAAEPFRIMWPTLSGDTIWAFESCSREKMLDWRDTAAADRAVCYGNASQFPAPRSGSAFNHWLWAGPLLAAGIVVAVILGVRCAMHDPPRAWAKTYKMP